MMSLMIVPEGEKALEVMKQLCRTFHCLAERKTGRENKKKNGEEIEGKGNENAKRSEKRCKETGKGNKGNQSTRNSQNHGRKNLLCRKLNFSTPGLYCYAV